MPERAVLGVQSEIVFPKLHPGSHCVIRFVEGGSLCTNRQPGDRCEEDKQQCNARRRDDANPGRAAQRLPASHHEAPSSGKLLWCAGIDCFTKSAVSTIVVKGVMMEIF